MELIVNNACCVSNWAGDEVGYPEIEHIALYSVDVWLGTMMFYVDVNTSELVDCWFEGVDE